MNDLIDFPVGMKFLLAVAVIWEAVWKGVGMWRAAKNNHTGWFVAIFILNTLGILPIIYLYLFQKNKRGASE